MALKRKEVRLITRNPTPRGTGMYIVGMHSPWMKLSQTGNLFGIWLFSVADWRVITPTTYGDNSKISPTNDFLSKSLIFFSRFLHREIPALLIFVTITNIGLIGVILSFVVIE